MTTKDLQKLFEKHEDEFIHFERVQNKLCSRPDVHAFIVLNQLCPDELNIISHAWPDEVWLAVSPEELAKAFAVDSHGELIIIDLIRCGVRYDSSTDSFAMFV